MGFINMKKQIVLEFNIDQSLTWDEAVISAREASKAAQLAIDTVLDRIGNACESSAREASKAAQLSIDTLLHRIGNGRGSAAGEVTIRWYGYGRLAKSVNGGTVQWYGKYLKPDSDDRS